MARSGRARDARTERGAPTACNRTVTTAAANTTAAQIVAEPASEAPTKLEEERRTCKKEVSASIIASVTSIWNAPTVPLPVGDQTFSEPVARRSTNWAWIPPERLHQRSTRTHA